MLKKLDEIFFSLRWPVPIVYIIVLIAWCCTVAYRKKHLTVSGAIAAFVTGVIVFWGTHIQGFLLLLFFFISSNLLGKYRCWRKGINILEKKHSAARDWVQVLANGLMAVIASLSYSTSGKISVLVMFGAAVAEATSDTWAGEIGRLSAKGPVSIRTMLPVPHGLSGGVTPLGFIAAFIGSFVVGILWILLFPIKVSFVSVLIITLAGFSGCVLDSFLGATFQAMYVDEKTDTLTEIDIDKNGKPRKLVRGIKWLDNDMVNLISNIFASLFAYLISAFD